MKGVIFRKQDDIIIAVIEDVISFSNNTLKSNNRLLELDAVNFDVVLVADDVEVLEGDILGTVVDIRNQLLPTLEERLAAAEAALLVLAGV